MSAFPADGIRFVIKGQAASKANSRQLVIIRGRPSTIKSAEARAFERDALLQIPASARVGYDGPVAVTLRIYYASERPDLDESIVLDVLQDQRAKVGAKRVVVARGVYLNDRQVREKHVYHGIDRVNPRVEIEVRRREPALICCGAELPPGVGKYGCPNCHGDRVGLL